MLGLVSDQYGKMVNIFLIFLKGSIIYFASSLRESLKESKYFNRVGGGVPECFNSRQVLLLLDRVKESTESSKKDQSCTRLCQIGRASCRERV